MSVVQKLDSIYKKFHVIFSADNFGYWNARSYSFCARMNMELTQRGPRARINVHYHNKIAGQEACSEEEMNDLHRLWLMLSFAKFVSLGQINNTNWTQSSSLITPSLT